MNTDSIKTYKGDKPYAFISYSHADSDIVMSIVSRFIRDGYRVWFDVAIEIGEDWVEDIADKIDKSACLIAFVSQNYLNSDNCRDEISYARSNKIPILILYIGTVELPKSFKLQFSRMQAVFFDKYIDNEAALFERIYESQILEQCKSDSVAVNSLDEVKFEITVSSGSGAVFIYSKKSRSESQNHSVIITNELWDDLVQRIKSLYCTVYNGLSADRIYVELNSDLGEYKCAPNDGYNHRDQCYRIDFKVSIISPSADLKFSSFHFDVYRNTFSLSFYNKQGNYVKSDNGEELKLCDLYIDKNKLKDAAESIIKFAIRTDNVIISDAFYTKSDMFKLDFIAPNN